MHLAIDILAGILSFIILIIVIKEIRSNLW